MWSQAKLMQRKQENNHKLPLFGTVVNPANIAVRHSLTKTSGNMKKLETGKLYRLILLEECIFPNLWI